MKELRPITKQRIYSILEETYFTKNNYDVSFPRDKAKEMSVKITFIPDPSCYYVIASSSSYGSQFMTRESPGTHLRGENSYQHNDFESCLKGITQWAARILDDYRQGSPVFNELDELRKSFEDEIDSHVRDESVHFSPVEKANIETKMDELLCNFEKLKKKNEITERELETIKTDLETLKADLENFPKKTWYRTAVSRIFKIFSKFTTSKEGRELVATAVKGFLMSGK